MHSIVDKHLGSGFWLVSCCSKHSCACLFGEHTSAFLFVLYIGVELLNYGSVSIYLTVVDNSKQFSKATVLIYAPGSHDRRSQAHYTPSSQLRFILKQNLFLSSLRRVFVEVDALFDAPCLPVDLLSTKFYFLKSSFFSFCIFFPAFY